MSGQLPDISPFGSHLAKIFVARQEHYLKLQLSHIVFLGYLSTNLGHQTPQINS
jgi:hypothetical protein